MLTLVTVIISVTVTKFFPLPAAPATVVEPLGNGSGTTVTPPPICCAVVEAVFEVEIVDARLGRAVPGDGVNCGSRDVVLGNAFEVAEETTIVVAEPPVVLGLEEERVIVTMKIDV
jgi:hypothetical protein